MLTQTQRDTFRLALASQHNYSIKSVDQLDIDDVISDGQVVETRDTIENFFSAQGRQLNRKGERPEIPNELTKTLLGDLYIWKNVQSRPGKRRGDLFVMDMGEARATYFDGEV